MAFDFSFIQRVGRSFMLPIALLPAAGILLGVGGAFSSAGTLEAYPVLNNPGLQAVLSVFTATGGVVFANLPLLFALAIPIGLARIEQGAAALAGAIAYLIMQTVIHQALVLSGVDFAKIDMAAEGYTTSLGIPTLQMGVFGGIIAGGGAVYLHNRYIKTKLPEWLGFFGGARLIPIITAFVFIIVGAVMYLVWPFVQKNIIMNLGWLVLHTGYFGTLIYGFIERSLIPFGLHPVFYIPFWQTAIGGQMEVCGQVVQGAQNIFFAQLACKDVTSFEVDQGTRFMTGKFPFMMFGLPGAALAMYQLAAPDKKQVTGSLLFSAAFTAFLTGITEPIEFTFLFLAPVLYAVHCVLAGISFMLMHILNVGVGMTFSGGFIDFMLFGVIQGVAKTNWIWIPAVGIVYFFIYYFLFRFVIQRWDLPTPGREEISKNSALVTSNSGDDTTVVGETGSAAAYIAALGGADNLIDVTNCITRLRVTVKEPTKVNKDKLKALGAKGVVNPGGGQGIQVIIGGRAPELKVEVAELLTQQGYADKISIS